MEDTLVNFGSEIKALSTAEDGTLTAGGYLVVFGSPSEHDATPMRDYFTKSTDFDIEDGSPTSVYYHHGLDPTLKSRKLGKGTLTIKDAGVWFETQLKARDEYEAKIIEMVKAGKLGLSSGTANHLVERERVGQAHFIKRWPLGLDASFTPTPGEPRAACMSLKSYSEVESDSEIEAPQVDVEAVAETKADTDAEPDELKSTHTFTTPDEVVSAISDILQTRMPLSWHAEAARTAVDSVTARLDGHPEVKAGHALSADSQSHIRDVRDALKATCERLDALVEAHAPEARESDTKSINEAEVQRLMARYAETMARINGVSLNGVPV